LMTQLRGLTRLAPARIGGGRSGGHTPEKAVSARYFFHLNHLATYHYTRKAWSVIEPVIYI
jgi:hypothetical protein